MIVSLDILQSTIETHLCDVQRSSVSLAVSKNNKHSSFADSSPNTIHLLGLPLQRVVKVLVHEGDIVKDRVLPDAPCKVNGLSTLL